MRILAALLCVLIMLLAAGHAADKPNLDGELVYRTNCTRCHMAIHTFPEPMLVTVTRHMHVRATLTDAETEAVLKFLEESSPQKKSKTQHQQKTSGSEGK